jgi:hypothetical protein
MKPVFIRDCQDSHIHLNDPTSTKPVSIRDILSHHIGIKTFEGEFTFWNTGLSREFFKFQNYE